METIEFGEESLSQPCVDRAVRDRLRGKCRVTWTVLHAGWLSSSCL